MAHWVLCFWAICLLCFFNLGRISDVKPKDPLLLQSLVLFLWILDCVHVALATHGVYFYLVTHYGEATIILKPVWSLIVIPVVSSISNLIVRITFAYRLWKLNGRAVLLHVATDILSLCVAGFAMFFSAKGLSVSTWSELHHFNWVVYAGFISEMTINIVITVAQIVCFRRLRVTVRGRSVDILLHTLIVYSIDTCFVTSVCSVMDLVFFLALPGTLLYFAFYFVISKLYFNAMLANLNARTSLQDNFRHSESSSMESHIFTKTLATVANATDK
ncbi:hypothetical protein OBBRIDRAFT_358976 [Obba rivulosa]|uniref:DUF6534 domain-containing protein n=1 Tax=Obba rivulosa TaxID=1052685 RepID=A0A8E2DUE0_9APHY|nr:hypothetical protein OBBRIDRAFT_358976 [Obba rivulosa]